MVLDFTMLVVLVALELAVAVLEVSPVPVVDWFLLNVLDGPTDARRPEKRRDIARLSRECVGSWSWASRGR